MKPKPQLKTHAQLIRALALAKQTLAEIESFPENRPALFRRMAGSTLRFLEGMGF